MRSKPEDNSTAQNRRRLVPNIKERERQADLLWIEENLLLCRSVVLDYFVVHGEGTLIANLTPSTHPSEEKRVWYLPAEQLATLDELEVKKLVEDYDPTREMVVVLLGRKGHRAYRVPLPPKFPGVH